MKICKLPIAMLLTFAMVLTTACESSDSDTGTVELNIVISDLPEDVEFDGTTLKFEGSGSVVGIDVELQATGRWYVLIPTNDDWLYFERLGNNVHLIAAANYSGIPRISRVDFAYRTTVKRILVEQDYLRLISFPMGDTLFVGASHANVAFPIRTTVAQENLSVKVTDPESAYWINPIAVNSREVVFTISYNTSPIDARRATITVSGEEVSASFDVVQKPISISDIPEEEN